MNYLIERAAQTALFHNAVLRLAGQAVVARHHRGISPRRRHARRVGDQRGIMSAPRDHAAAIASDHVRVGTEDNPYNIDGKIVPTHELGRSRRHRAGNPAYRDSERNRRMLGWLRGRSWSTDEQRKQSPARDRSARGIGAAAANSASTVMTSHPGHPAPSRGGRHPPEVQANSARCLYISATWPAKRRSNRLSADARWAGHHDVLVNNAGIVLVAAVEDILRAVHARSREPEAPSLCKHVLPVLKAKRGGAIVNMGSVSGHVGRLTTRPTATGRDHRFHARARLGSGEVRHPGQLDQPRLGRYAHAARRHPDRVGEDRAAV